MAGVVPRVLVVGGGPGGLEAVLALGALAGDRLEIELLSAEPRFTYRPWAVAEPFGVGHTVGIDLLRVAHDRGFALTIGTLRSVDAAARTVTTDDGTIAYDQLVLALGARPVPSVAGALTFRGPRDSRSLHVALEQRTSADGSRVVYIGNSSAYWPLPAYELALMTDVWARRRGHRPAIALVTAEREPLEAFGAATSARVRALLEARGIRLYTHTVAESHAGGRLLVPGAGTIAADLAVALPALIGRPIDGLPRDEAGFVPVDDLCRVAGLEHVYAVGDMTARPLKQGGLATQQADVAAAAIAAAAGVPTEVRPYSPVLRAMLLTGEGPAYLRSPDAAGADVATDSPWWPPHKIAGAHLAPYLATHSDVMTPVTADA
jgi:sulfide:quinone oxidoreductase